MRVVLVTNGLAYGGAERIVQATAVDLSRRGDSVHVVATTRDGPVGEELRAAGIPVSVLHIRHALDGRVAIELAGIARAFRAQIIHSHLAVSDIATAIAGVALPHVRLVSTVHSAYVGLGRVRLAVWRTLLRRFDRVIAVSERVKELLPKQLEATIVRPSLIDLPGRIMSREDARARLGIAPGQRVVIAIGRLVPVKGFDVLARACAMLETPGARVLVIGDGPERDRLEQEPHLELLGGREDAALLVTAADVVVSSSRSEGFPQTPLHAMAASIPVVATRVGGTPEIVVHEETGLLVPPDDASALARAIDAILGDPERARRFGEAGRERLVREGMTQTAMIDRTREIYAGLINRGA